ncbi:hypothetical protein D3C72_1541840 [compost metagenome]
MLCLLGFVDDLEGINVFDLTQVVLTEQATVLDHVHRYHRSLLQGDDQRTNHDHQRGDIAEQARSQPVGLATLQVVFGLVADQATGVAHFVHDRITGVDARRAADAFHLQAIADVDTGRADLHTHLAINTVAQAFGLVVAVFFARAAGFAA